MDNYYLQINLIKKNNKRIVNNYQLYNNDKLIKQFSDNDTKRISNIIKQYKKYNNLHIDKSKDNYRIYDISFIKKYIGIPSKKIINKYSKEIAILSTITLGLITTSIIDHKVNPNLYTTSLENDNSVEDDDFIYVNNESENIKEIENESVFDKIDSPIVYYPEEKKDYTIKYYSDNDYNINQNVNDIQITSSMDNTYKFEFNYDDRSNEEYLNIIKDVYKNSIEKCSNKYGIDKNLIVAMICQENKEATVNNSSIGGVGLLQVERQVWNGYTMNDIDGNQVKIDCDQINNISSDYNKMKIVSNYLNDLENKKISENDYINYNITQEDILKYHNAEKSIEIGCMISESYQNQIINNNKNNTYSYKLTDEECEILGIWSHNKGINQIEACLKSTNSFEETLNTIKQTPYGDNEYLEHVFSYLPDEAIITMKTRDKAEIHIKVKNQEMNYVNAM